MQVTKVLGLAAVGAVLVLAAPAAQALSLSNPGAATAVQQDTRQATTEVRWGHRHGGWHRHRGWHRGWHHRRWHHRHWRRW